MDKNKLNQIVRNLELLARELELLGLESQMEKICQVVYEIDFDYLEPEVNS